MIHAKIPKKLISLNRNFDVTLWALTLEALLSGILSVDVFRGRPSHCLWRKCVALEGGGRDVHQWSHENCSDKMSMICGLPCFRWRRTTLNNLLQRIILHTLPDTSWARFDAPEGLCLSDLAVRVGKPSVQGFSIDQVDPLNQSSKEKKFPKILKQLQHSVEIVEKLLYC